MIEDGTGSRALSMMMGSSLGPRANWPSGLRSLSTLRSVHARHHHIQQHGIREARRAVVGRSSAVFVRIHRIQGLVG